MDAEPKTLTNKKTEKNIIEENTPLRLQFEIVLQV